MSLEEYLSDLESNAAAAAGALSAVAARLRGAVPPGPVPSIPPLADEGVGFEAALAELTSLVPASMATGAPGYLGLLNTSPLPAAIAGDLFVSALNNNAGAAHQGPAAAALEAALMRALLALVGWRDGIGQLVPAGSYANLHGLLLARRARLPEWDARGPSALARAPRIYASASSHFSVARGARVAGFGAENVVAIPVIGRGALDADALARRIAADREAGHAPIAVVATLGSTATGALDPIDAIADRCDAEGLWLHVDACYGGGMLILPEFAHQARAVARADSIAIDPHKQWYMPIACGAVLTRHPEVERAAFAPGDVSYIPSSNGEFPDAYLRGISTSRRASAIGIWLALRTHGWNGLRERVRRNVALIRRLEAALAAAGFEVLEGGELSTACARWPGGDEIQEAIAARAVASGKTWFATTRHDGRSWLRFTLVNCTADEASLDVVAGAVVRAAHEVGAAHTR